MLINGPLSKILAEAEAKAGKLKPWQRSLDPLGSNVVPDKYQRLKETDHPLAIELDILLEGKAGAAQNAVREEGPQWMVTLVDKHVTPLRDELRRLKQRLTELERHRDNGGLA